MDWRGKLYGVYPTCPADNDRYAWQYLCPSCARDRGKEPDEKGRSPRDVSCPMCESTEGVERVGHHERKGRLRRVFACDCGNTYTLPATNETWSDFLYQLCVSDAPCPEQFVLVDHYSGDDYADIICTRAGAQNIIRCLRAKGYEYDEQRGTSGSAMRVRIRVWRDHTDDSQSGEGYGS